jgi:hypothetical protein
MSDFDPFGGSSGPSHKKQKISDNQITKIKQVISIVIVIGILYFLVSYFLFNNTEITVTLNNTEDERITTGSISFRMQGKQEQQTFSISDKIKLKKGLYSYVIRVPEYKLKTVENKSFKEKQHTINETLEKNIQLSVESFNMLSTNFYLGQRVDAEITLKNTSTVDSYSLDMIEFTKDAKDWTFSFVNVVTQDVIDPSEIQIAPSTTQKYYLFFEIPSDEKIGEKTILPKIKYLNIDNAVDKKINVIDIPNISVSCTNTNKTYEFGDNISNIVCEIDNSKNKELAINDLEITLDVVSDNELVENVDEWFVIPSGQRIISAGKKGNEYIEIKIPSENLFACKITGTIIFKSKYFSEGSKTQEIEITFEEPDILFSVSLTQASMSIDYDILTSQSEMKYTSLKLNNRNNFRININNIDVISPGLIKDCNNLIYYDEDLILGSITQKTENIVPITVSILDNSLLEDTTQTRPCSIKITLENPFREDDFLEYITNLEITTNIIDIPE